MQDTAYADAQRPAPGGVLKLPLRNYSLGHELLLLRERNAFLLVSPSDFKQLPLAERIYALHRATWICANGWEQNVFERFVFLKARLLQWRRRGLTAADYEAAAIGFFNYLAAGRSFPQLSPRRMEKGEKPGRPFGGPLLAQLHEFLLGRTDVATTAAAWDYPFGAAVWRYFVKLETDGAVQIENAEEQAGRLQAEESRNRYANGCAAWTAAATDAARAEVLAQYPDVRGYAATEPEVKAFEARKEAACRV